MNRWLACLVATGFLWGSMLGAQERQVVSLWPDRAPGETKELPPEADTQKPTDRLVAGKTVIKLGNVSTPTLTVYPAPADRNTGAAVIVCPGGGHHILAMDLEGTEVAEWLNSIGITALLLKYRVPARHEDKRWLAAVQDAQRALRVARHHASQWHFDPNRLGILGFSAGGETAGLASIFFDRSQYTAVDDLDSISCRPDFAVLIYPGGLVPRGGQELHDYVKVPAQAPPLFLAHSFDDGVTPLNSLLLAGEWKKAGVPAELHLYATGGHGYGLRPTEEPCTQWPQRCHEWMKRIGLLTRRE